MDHEETREQLELAALEPGGLERLMAGDTATAQAVAAHLAGCPVVHRTSSSALGRASAAHPRRRPRAAAARSQGADPGRHPGRGRPAAARRRRTAGRVARAASRRCRGAPAARRAAASQRLGAGPAVRGQVLGWFGAIAAAVVLSVVTTTFIIGSRVDEQLAAQNATIDALEERHDARRSMSPPSPTPQHVALAGVTDPTLDGNLVFSPATTELVVVS